MSDHHPDTQHAHAQPARRATAWSAWRKLLGRMGDFLLGLTPRHRAAIRGHMPHARLPSLRKVDPQYLRCAEKGHGPRVFVQIRRAAAARGAAHFAGWAAIDTGSPGSLLSSHVAQQLHLKSIGETTLTTRDGKEKATTHRVGLWLPALDGFHLAIADFEIIEHKPAFEEVLLGMDALARMALCLDAVSDPATPLEMWF